MRRIGHAAASVKIGRARAVKGSAAASVVFVVRTKAHGRRLHPGRYRLTAVEHTRFGTSAPDRVILRVVR
jgi:hypothetical protein